MIYPQSWLIWTTKALLLTSIEGTKQSKHIVHYAQQILSINLSADSLALALKFIAEPRYPFRERDQQSAQKIAEKGAEIESTLKAKAKKRKLKRHCRQAGASPKKSYSKAVSLVSAVLAAFEGVLAPFSRSAARAFKLRHSTRTAPKTQTAHVAATM